MLSGLQRILYLQHCEWPLGQISSKAEWQHCLHTHILIPKMQHSLLLVTVQITLLLLSCLFQVIARCDVCLLQEVRDSKETALPLLLVQLNR